MMLGLFFTPFDILVLPGLLLGLYAQAKIMGAYSRYMRVPASSGLTGAQAARKILDAAGLYDVSIEIVPGTLSDHYDPINRVLRLSKDNYYGRSIAALGVAAHEAGHALQHATGYAFMLVRMSIAPVTGFLTQAAFMLFGIGLMLMVLGIISPAIFSKILPIAILGYAAATGFHLITLPVEYDASRRAAQKLIAIGIIDDETELYGVRQVLNAAALTYVAALVTSILELLRLILIARYFGGNDRG